MHQEPFNFLKQANILVVDDTPTNITLLTQILSSQGYKVRVAPGGKLALKSIQSILPDLILLDVKMPDLNGYQVCRQLKSHPSTRDIPVIFMSALDDALDKVTAFTLGGVDYITKPFEAIEVIARIKNQLRLYEFQLQLQAQNAQLQLMLATAQAISETADVEEALLAILTKVCETIGWDFGEAWMPNAEATHLEYCAWWPNALYLEEFQRQSENLNFGLAEGFPGKVWASQQIEWIADLSDRPSLMVTRSEQAKRAGLKSVLGIPIVLDAQVLAVLVFFHHTELAPDERSLQLFKAIATQLGSMIQRKKTEDALRQANWELERLAHLDGLTQLANRRRFDVYLRQQWQEGNHCDLQPLSIILFDVDYFKLYNDFYGHQAGDECLQQLSVAARQAISQPADLVARYGGEEFVAILPNTSATQALEIAERLRQAVHQLQIPHQTSRVKKFVTISIGVTSAIPSDRNMPETLVADADRALYQAKEQGRDRIVLAQDSGRVSLASHLHSQSS